MLNLPPALEADGWQAYDDETFLGHVGGIVIRAADTGYEYGIVTTQQHSNLSGRLHGGIYMTLFDRAMGETLRASNPGVAYATAQMSTDFLRPVLIGGFVTFRAELVRLGRTAVNMRAEAVSEGKLVGTATALFLRAANTYDQKA